MNPEDILYHREHTWARIEKGKATIGITDYAQKALGDIVYVELPEIEYEVVSGEKLSDIESTKATSEVISPVSGRVIQVNEELADTPEVINEDPYNKGWIAVLELTSEAEELIEASDYEKYLEDEAK
ncbi:MAG TPA: glycine cleavage system protein GcvH [Thermodesulfovibrionia bacterium]|nr:glycine cleavage system protein GcvH [Thermodesulfovibrionia bacterium]